MNARVPLASAYPAMARTAKVCVCILMFACMGVRECVHPFVRVSACACMFL